MVAKREISIMEQIFKNRLRLQICRDIYFLKLPQTGYFSSLTSLIRMNGSVTNLLIQL